MNFKFRLGYACLLMAGITFCFGAWRVSIYLFAAAIGILALDWFSDTETSQEKGRQ